MNIVVLCGGISNERDVSISSGTQVSRALRERGHRVLLLDLFFGYEGEYSDPLTLFDLDQENNSYTVAEKAPDLETVKASRKQDNDSLIGDNVLEICRCADIVFLALHGEEGENGKLQAVLDMAGVKYTGSGYLGSALAMNKELSKKLFQQAGIPTPQSLTLRKGETAAEKPTFPCVVKPCSGGSSVGTSIVYDETAYADALSLAFQYEDSVLVETYVHGRELTVGVMDGRAMPVIEIIVKNGFYDYKNKYQAGLTEEVCPAQIPQELTLRAQRLSERVMDCLKVDAYCRTDLLYDEEKDVIYCLEANTLPGMTPTSLIPQMAAAEGMAFGELCEKIIEVSLKKYGSEG